MKKQFLTLFLSGCMAASFAATNPATAIAEGDGTDGSPYKISSVGELLFMRDKTNSSDEDAGVYRSASYVLTTDLDMVDEADWEPICKTSSFGGSFDGKGYAIKNLKFGTPAACLAMSGVDIGLFGVIKNGKVSNLKVDNVAFYAVYSSEYQLGGIAGSFRAGVIDNCFVSGILMTDEPNGVICSLGGIVGRVNTPNETVATLIVNSFSDITIKAICPSSAVGRMHIGGIAGNVSGSTNSTVSSKIVNSYSSANITVDASSKECYVAGIAGQLTGTDIKMLISNCYASGDIVVKSSIGNVSGVIGRSNVATATVSNCMALNNSVKFEKNTIPFRIAKNSKASPFSGNFALGTDFMTLQRINSSSEWTDVDPVSDATGEHGETLTGETLTEQVNSALTKLNAFVTANPKVENISLKTWEIEAGNGYPVFYSVTTGVTPNTVKTAPVIINKNGGVEITAPGLSDVMICDVSGRKLYQSRANGSIFVNMPEKGIFIISGLDMGGKKLFSQQHIIR